jgi:hypothetical protein
VSKSPTFIAHEAQVLITVSTGLRGSSQSQSDQVNLGHNRAVEDRCIRNIATAETYHK